MQSKEERKLSQFLCRGLQYPLLILLAMFSKASAFGINPDLKKEHQLLAAEIAPYVYLKDGLPAGPMAKVIQEMAHRSDHSGKIEFLPWARAQKLVRDQKDSQIRFILPLTRTPEREDHYIWVVEVMKDDLVFVTDKAKQPEIKNIDDAKNLRVGVLLGSPGEAELKQRGFTNIDASVNEDVNARKLNSSRIDAWLVARTVAPFSWKREALPPKDLEYGVVVRSNHLYLGAAKSTPPDVVARWRKAFDEMKADGTYMRLMNDVLVSSH